MATMTMQEAIRLWIGTKMVTNPPNYSHNFGPFKMLIWKIIMPSESSRYIARSETLIELFSALKTDQWAKELEEYLQNNCPESISND